MDKGEGEVLLLLHGVPTSGWLYRHMIDTLAKSYRVIAPDMLGYGSSDSPEGYEIYSEENHANRLLALMDSLKIETWSHVMHDAGGLWTWALMKNHSQRISRLLILNTVIYEAGFKPPIRFQKGWLAQVAMWSYRNGISTNLMLKGLFKTGLTKNTLSKEALAGYKTPLLEGKTKAMYYFFTQTCTALPDVSEIIKKLDLPVLVIWGKNDDFLKWKPQADSVRQDVRISDKNIHLIDAKHFIQEEQPELINELLLTFLKEH